MDTANRRKNYVIENHDVLIASEQRKTKQISKDLRITQEKNIRNARNENSRRQVRQGEDIYEDVKDSYVKHAVKGNLEEVEEDEREKVGQIGSKTKYYENNSAEDSPSGRSYLRVGKSLCGYATKRERWPGWLHLGNTCHELMLAMSFQYSTHRRLLWMVIIGRN